MANAFKRAAVAVGHTAAIAAIRHALVIAGSAVAAQVPRGWRTGVIAYNPATGERLVVGQLDAATLRVLAHELDG